MYFDKLSDDEWALLRPMMSAGAAQRLTRRGRPRADLRLVANAVLWVLTTGEPWSRLPCGYPSGPTCRCRFDEWLESGVLAEMIELLSRSGRSFIYNPASPSAAEGRAAPCSPRFLRDDGVAQVLWKSADAWQASSGTTARTPGTTPFSEITRQLSGGEPHPRKATKPGVTPKEGRSPQSGQAPYSPLMGLYSQGKHVDDARGYVIHAAADAVPGTSFRAWAEIVKSGRRVARSGLIGPRFANLESAQQYALDWARRWIDRHCPVPPVSEPAASAATASNALACARPVQPAPADGELEALCHEHIRW